MMLKTKEILKSISRRLTEKHLYKLGIWFNIFFFIYVYTKGYVDYANDLNSEKASIFRSKLGLVTLSVNYIAVFILIFMEWFALEIKSQSTKTIYYVVLLLICEAAVGLSLAMMMVSFDTLLGDNKYVWTLSLIILWSFPVILYSLLNTLIHLTLIYNIIRMTEQQNSRSIYIFRFSLCILLVIIVQAIVPLHYYFFSDPYSSVELGNLQWALSLLAVYSSQILLRADIYEHAPKCKLAFNITVFMNTNPQCIFLLFFPNLVIMIIHSVNIMKPLDETEPKMMFELRNKYGMFTTIMAWPYFFTMVRNFCLMTRTFPGAFIHCLLETGHVQWKSTEDENISKCAHTNLDKQTIHDV